MSANRATPIGGRLFGFGHAVEPIADPGLCQDVLRLIGIELELFAQILDDRPKVIDLVSVIGSPDRL